LGKIPNLRLLPLVENDLCCGSAGMYNLDQPEIARALGARKARNLVESGAQVVVSGNIGCQVQIRTHLQSLGKPLPVLHTVEILDMAYRAQYSG
jgi:glycolate oxidase iron-sulfur subunit